MISKKLNEMRGDLDRIDRRLVETLRDRLQTVAGIARLKAEGLPFLRDHERESELLGRIETWARELGIDGFRTQEIFREVIAMALKAQEEELLKRAQKSVNTQRPLRDRIESLYAHGLAVFAGFILGFDGENGDIDVAEDELLKLRKEMRLPYKSARDACLNCHDLDNSPDFHVEGAFEEFWEQVAH